eukprot:g3756.t1
MNINPTPASAPTPAPACFWKTWTRVEKKAPENEDDAKFIQCPGGWSFWTSTSQGFLKFLPSFAAVHCKRFFGPSGNIKLNNQIFGCAIFTRGTGGNLLQVASLAHRPSKLSSWSGPSTTRDVNAHPTSTSPSKLSSWSGPSSF